MPHICSDRAEEFEALKWQIGGTERKLQLFKSSQRKSNTFTLELTWSASHIHIFLKVSLRTDNSIFCIIWAHNIRKPSKLKYENTVSITIKGLFIPWAEHGHFGKIHQSLHWCPPGGPPHDTSLPLGPTANKKSTEFIVVLVGPSVVDHVFNLLVCIWVNMVFVVLWVIEKTE